MRISDPSEIQSSPVGVGHRANTLRRDFKMTSRLKFHRHCGRWLHWCFILVFILFPFSSHAKIIDLRPDGPLLTRTQHPIYLNLLAMPMEAPQTLNKNQFESSIETTFSNIFEYDTISQTQINLDMELYRTALNFSYGLSDKLDVKIELPFISTAGGFLDRFVEGYHDLFNLPESGRKFAPYDEVHFTVIRRGRRLVDFNSIPMGLTDITVRFKYLLSDHFSWPFKLALAPYLKLPTGQVTDGLSSGHFDGGLSLLFQKDLKRFHLTTHVGLALLGNHKYLDPILGHVFFSFGQSVRFQLWNHFSLVAQITGNTSPFENVDTRDLREIILDLNTGVAGEIPLRHSIFDEIFYQASLSEDILSSGPSVDFSLLMRFGVRY